MWFYCGWLIYNVVVSLAKPDIYHIDTSNVLFILSGAFVGLDNVVKRRVAKGVRTQFVRLRLRNEFNLLLLGCGQSIGFTANLPQPEEDNQNGFMPFFTPNRRTSQNILDLVEPAGEHPT
jgi:ATP-dependent Clp protease ATP-binding subunit ClpX